MGDMMRFLPLALAVVSVLVMPACNQTLDFITGQSNAARPPEYPTLPPLPE